MKVYLIKDREENEFYYLSLHKFCKNKNITERLLRYTNPINKDKKINGKKARYQKFSNGYRIDSVVEFLESDDGNIVLENGKKGYIIKTLENSKTIPYIPITKENIVTNEDNSLKLYDNKVVEYTDQDIRKILKENQRLKDTNTYLRKIGRDSSRIDIIIDNFLESFKNLYKVLDRTNSDKFTKYITTNNSNKHLIAQISDVHFGSTSGLDNNPYSIEIAESRLNKYCNKIIELCKAYNINYITIAFTGDMFSLTYAHDMIHVTENLRIASLINGVAVIKKFINTLLNSGIKLDLISVYGNESRLVYDKPISNVEEFAKDNLDCLMFYMLKEHYVNNPNIKFLNNGDKLYDIISINNLNIAISHGYIPKSHTDTALKLFKHRIFQETGVMPDYLMFGHIHSHYITPEFARCGSIIGGNSYSLNELNIPFSQCSQNILLIENDKILSCLPINL